MTDPAAQPLIDATRVLEEVRLSAAASSAEFVDQWFGAKWDENFEKCVSLAFDRHDENDVPPWLSKDIQEPNMKLATELSNNLNRRDDSFLGEKWAERRSNETSLRDSRRGRSPGSSHKS